MTPWKISFMPGIPVKKCTAKFYDGWGKFRHGSIISGQRPGDKRRIKMNKKDKGNTWEDDNL